MSIILIGGEKGGTGKTTLAVNIAAARARDGHDVLLVDTDPQGSASYWAAAREEAGIEPRAGAGGNHRVGTGESAGAQVEIAT